MAKPNWVKFDGKIVDAESVLCGIDIVIQQMDGLVAINPHNNVVAGVRNSIIRTRYELARQIETL